MFILDEEILKDHPEEAQMLDLFQVKHLLYEFHTSKKAMEVLLVRIRNPPVQNELFTIFLAIN